MKRVCMIDEDVFNNCIKIIDSLRVKTNNQIYEIRKNGITSTDDMLGILYKVKDDLYEVLNQMVNEE